MSQSKAEDTKFMRIYEKYRVRIYWYVYRKISSQSDAEDLTADVFLKLYENWSELTKRKENGILAWIYTVARNAAIDHLRKKGRRSVACELDNVETDQATAVYDDFVRDAMQDEMMKEVRNALSLLDEEERDILQLRFQEGLRFGEIASIIGKNEGTCKMILYRSIDKIKEDINNKQTPKHEQTKEQKV